MSPAPIRDQVAIVGVGSTGFSRNANRSQGALALEACTSAIADAGVKKSDIDGVVGTLSPEVTYTIAALGLTSVTFFGNQRPPFGFTLMAAMHAIHSGACDVVLAYNAVYRVPAMSRSAAADPFRRHLMFGGGPATKRLRYDPEDMGGAVGYAAWASRYLVESNTRRDQWRYVALNARANAQLNPLAAMRDPITAQEYADARLVREPFCLFDMDLPVDGADAFILTSAARASDLTDNPVLVHAATAGITAPCEEDQAPSLRNHGQQVVAKKLRQQSEIWLDSVDLFYPYDGFTSIALAWFENIGWCGFGDAGPFLESHWNDATDRILIDGRIPVNTHGGQLAEGASQASGHVREAVTQLQGRAGDRQVTGAKTALLTLGGFFKNSQGVILRRP